MKMTTQRLKDSALSVTLTDGCVKKAVKSYALSKRYINTMLKAAVINIMYHRLNISESEFITKSFKNVPFKSFRSKTSNNLIREYFTYMTACKDAIEKNYLKEFYLYFINSTTGDIFENYKFSFHYNQDAGHQTEKAEDLITSTCQLLQTLEDLSNQKKTDFDLQLAVELTYFDDTPLDYEPPGFKTVTETNSLMYKLKKTGNSILLGRVNTGFHLLKCRVKGDAFNFNESASATPEREANEQLVDTPMLTEDLSDPVNERPHPVSPYNQMNDTYISDLHDEIYEIDDEAVECLCNIPEMDSCTVDNITCASCKRLFHVPCEGYLDRSFINGSTLCINCKEDDEESIVNKYELEKCRALFRIRFIIGALYKYGTFPEALRKVFDETARNLKELDVFEIEGSKIGINFEVLRTIFKFDFKMPDVNRLNSITYFLEK